MFPSSNVERPPHKWSLSRGRINRRQRSWIKFVQTEDYSGDKALKTRLESIKSIPCLLTVWQSKILVIRMQRNPATHNGIKINNH